MIADDVGISQATVLKNLHEDLAMNKVLARWIPKLLNPGQKLCRQPICQENLRVLADDKELSSKIVTSDETLGVSLESTDKTRIHAVGPLVHKASPLPKKQERRTMLAKP
jgi:hypothetical protein